MTAIPRQTQTIVLDVFERTILTILYGVFSYRILSHFSHTGNVAGMLALASETSVMLLVIIRRPAQEITFRVQDWALAFGASWASLLLRPANVVALGPAFVGWFIQAVALGVQIWGKANLFRNFGVTPAVRNIVIKGPYAFVRHPLYASYFIGELGFLYAFPTWWNALIIVGLTIAQIVRIHVEERLLRREPRFQSYAAKVRWRLVPWVY